MSDEIDLQSFVTRFEERAKRRRLEAHATLALIVLVLSAGVSTYLLAPGIAQRDISGELERSIEEYRSDIADLERQLVEIEQDLSVNFVLFRDTIDLKCNSLFININPEQAHEMYDYILRWSDRFTSRSRPVTSEIGGGELGLKLESGAEVGFSRPGDIIACAKALRDIENELFGSAVLDLNQKKQTEYLLSQIKSEIERKNLTISTLEEEILRRRSQFQAADSLPETQTASVDAKFAKDAAWLQLIQTNVTRFGTLFIVLFLVAILIPQYRYSIRLAAFYDAKADALLLRSLELGPISFDELAGVLTPSLDFGKAPYGPTKELVELVRQLNRAQDRK